MVIIFIIIAFIVLAFLFRKEITKSFGKNKEKPLDTPERLADLKKQANSEDAIASDLEKKARLAEAIKAEEDKIKLAKQRAADAKARIRQSRGG